PPFHLPPPECANEHHPRRGKPEPRRTGTRRARPGQAAAAARPPLPGDMPVRTRHAGARAGCRGHPGACLRQAQGLRPQGAVARAPADPRPPHRRVHSHNAVAHYLAVLASLGLGVAKLINTRHGMGGMQRWNRAEMLYRASLARTDAVALVCEAACNGAIEHGLVPRRKLRVVPNGLRVQEFTVAAPAARERLRQALALSPQTRLVGTVGRLNWAKDQANLIRAFRRVRDQQADSALLLVGDGLLRPELEACARDE